jgi:hypothetical protein
MIAFSLILLLAGLAGWIAAKGAPARARPYLRIAAALYGALALSGPALEVLTGLIHLPGLTDAALLAVRDLVVTLGAALLCVAAYSAFRGAPDATTASVVLAVAALIGLAAAFTGFPVLAALPQAVSAVLVFLLARPALRQRPNLYLGLSALSLLGAAACQSAPGIAARAGVLLFVAAALIGVAFASNVLVEQRNQHKRALAVTRGR